MHDLDSCQVRLGLVSNPEYALTLKTSLSQLDQLIAKALQEKKQLEIEEFRRDRKLGKILKMEDMRDPSSELDQQKKILEALTLKREATKDAFVKAQDRARFYVDKKQEIMKRLQDSLDVLDSITFDGRYDLMLKKKKIAQEIGKARTKHQKELETRSKNLNHQTKLTSKSRLMLSSKQIELEQTLNEISNLKAQLKGLNTNGMSNKDYSIDYSAE